MCKGYLSEMDQEAIISGIITCENGEYKFTNAIFFNNDITEMQKAFHRPHDKFAQTIKNSSIIMVIKDYKVKDLRNIIRKLKEAQKEPA